MKGYRDQIYERYWSMFLAYERQDATQNYERRRVMFRKYFGRFLPADRHARIVDVASGVGEFLHFLQEEGYENSFGVEVSEEQVEMARKMGIRNVIHDDCFKVLRQYVEEVDLITAHDFLEHLKKFEVLRFLALCNNALKAEGTLVISTPNAEGLFGAAHRYSEFTHQTAYTPRSLSHVLRLSGFDDIRIYPKGPYVHGIKSFIRWLCWKMIETCIKSYLLVETGNIGSGVYTQIMYAVASKPKARQPGRTIAGQDADESAIIA